MNATEIRKQIQIIRHDVRNKNKSNLKKKISKLFENYLHNPIILPQPSVFENEVRLHRAIKYTDRPSEIRNLSYPPSECARMGRANYEGDVVFYCSGDPRSTLFELDPTKGDKIVLSKWALIGELLISPLGYTNKCFTNLKSDRDCPIIIPSHARPKATSKLGNKLIDKFLSEEFTRIDYDNNTEPYYLTALISELYLTLRPECGIVYPTIAMHANAENFALTPLAVDNKMQIQEAHWLEITNVGRFEYTVKPLSYANSFINGCIEWTIYTEVQKRNLGKSFSAQVHYD